jgi:hypothetical protein
MKRFLIRYGVFTLLIIMVAGIVGIAAHYEIRSKQPLTLVVVGDSCRGYVDRGAFAPHCGDTIEVCQTPYGTLPFTLDTLLLEPDHAVLLLEPLSAADFRQRTAHNTCMSGFVFVGHENMLRMIRRKIGL